MKKADLFFIAKIAVGAALGVVIVAPVVTTLWARVKP